MSAKLSPCTPPRLSWVGFEENDKGTLEIGKLADIAVLAEDPFADSAPEKIRDLKVEMTLVGGRVSNTRDMSDC